MEKQTIAGIMIIGGILLLLLTLVLAAPDEINAYLKKDGNVVNCNVKASATLVTGKLQIDPSSACTRAEACRTGALSLVGGITGTDVKGQLLLKQSGKNYDSIDVTENRFTAGHNYGLSACIPSSAVQVRLTIINENGGVDDDRAVNIN